MALTERADSSNPVGDPAERRFFSPPRRLTVPSAADRLAALAAVRAELDSGQPPVALERLVPLLPVFAEAAQRGVAPQKMYGSALSLLGRIRAELGEREEAVQAFVEAVAVLAPLSDDFDRREVLDLGVAQYGAGMAETAAATLSSLSTDDEAPAELWPYLGLALFESGRRAEAEPALMHAVAIAPNDPEVHMALGELALDGERPEEAAEHFTQGAIALGGLGRFDEARTYAQRSVDAHEDPLGLAVLGELLRLLGRYDEALRALDRAIALEPGQVYATVSRANLLAVLGRTDEAATEIQRTVALHPTDAFALTTGSQILGMSGRLDEALALARMAVDVMHDSASARALSDILRQLGRNDEALEACDQALALDPTDSDSMASKAEILLEIGRGEEALELWRRIVALNPMAAWSRLGLSRALRFAGRDDEALAAVDEALALDPSDWQSLAMKGELLLAADQAEAALDALRSAVGLAPGVDWLLIDLSNALVEARRPDEAIAVFDGRLESQPDNPNLWSRKGGLLQRLGRFDEAIECLRRLVQLVPESGRAHYELGESLRLAGRFEQALLEVDRALELGPAEQLIIGTKGQILAAMGELGPALELLQQAAALEPSPPWLSVATSEVLVQLERENEALKVLDHALAENPKNPALWMEKGQLLLNLGRLETALELFEQSLRVVPRVSRLYELTGETQRRLGRYEDALISLNTALDIDATAGWAWGTKGQVLSAMGDLDGALAAFDRAGDYPPVPAWALVERADVLRRLGRPRDALACADEVLESVPNMPFAHWIKGLVLWALDEREASVAENTLAAELEPDSYPAHAELAESLRLMERFGDSLEHAERAIELRPNDSFAWGTKGRVLRAQGDLEGALAALEQAAAINPDLTWVRVEQARVLADLGRDDEAAVVSALVLKSEFIPVNIEWHIDLLNRMRRRQEALTLADGGLREFADDPSLLKARVRVLIDNGQRTDALLGLEHILSLSPDDWLASGMKAWVLVEIAEFESAATIFGQLAADYPEEPWIESGRAQALLYLGPNRAVEAVEAYRRATQLDPVDTQSQALLGEALWSTGRHNEARRCWEEVLSRLDANAPDERLFFAAAWSCYMLGRYDEASRLLLRAISLNPDPINRLNLGLIYLASGQDRPALHEYHTAVSAARGLDPAYRRGLLHVALIDIDNAITREVAQETAPAVGEVRRLLREHHDEAEAAMTLPYSAKSATGNRVS